MAHTIAYEREYYSSYPSDLPIFVIRWVVNIIEFMLTLRLLLVLFGASSASSFVAWIYDVTGRLVGPFSGAFPSLILGGFVIDISTIFAMIGYAIIGWLLVQVLVFIGNALARPI